MEEKYYTVTELSRLLHVSRQTIYDWINSGRLKAIRVGRVIRIPASSVVSLISPVEPGTASDE